MSSTDLNQAFATYFDSIDRCQSGNAYWPLLHVIVCLPDICAALQSDDGETTRARYKDWCTKYFAEPLLNAEERYRMRCKVLHQGRASTDQPGRYLGFAFGQPTGPTSDHLREEKGILHLDVAKLATEYRQAVATWIKFIESSSKSPEAAAVATHLPSLVQVALVGVPISPDKPGDGVVQILKTY